MEGHGQNWIARKAVICFLYVSREAAQALTLVIGALDLVYQATPEMSSLVLFPVSVDISMAPLVSVVQHVPGLEGTEAPIQQTKDSYRPIVACALWAWSLGQTGHFAGDGLVWPCTILLCPGEHIAQAVQQIGSCCLQNLCERLHPSLLLL